MFHSLEENIDVILKYKKKNPIEKIVLNINGLSLINHNDLLDDVSCFSNSLSYNFYLNNLSKDVFIEYINFKINKKSNIKRANILFDKSNYYLLIINKENHITYHKITNRENKFNSNHIFKLIKEIYKTIGDDYNYLKNDRIINIIEKRYKKWNY